MSHRVTKTVKTETEVVQPHDTPDVLAYRVGQLEKTTAAGLKEVKDELVNLKTHFVTHAELESAKVQADMEHKAINEEISDVKVVVDKLQQWRDSIVTRIAAGAIIMLVLMVLAFYGLDKFFK